VERTVNSANTRTSEPRTASSTASTAATRWNSQRSGIPFMLEGGRLLFRRSQLDTWLERRDAA
jgi:hypothetical protein